MRLIYAFPEPLPLERARGLQTTHTIAAVARAGLPVELAFSPIPGPDGIVDPFAHYAIERPFDVNLVPVPRAMPWPLSGLHSNRIFFFNLRRRFGPQLTSTPIYVRHLKLAAMMATQLPAARFIYEAHEVFGDTAAPARQAANRKLEKLVIATAGAIVTNSRGTASRLTTLYGQPADLEIIPNGVERPLALPPKPWAEAAQHIVYAGSFFPWKGVDVLMEAAAGLSDCRISLIGGDKARASEWQARPDSTGARIDFVGRLPQQEVMSRLAGACIAVLPNRDHPDSTFTSPIKLFEYMASGCAIVASDLGALREILGEQDAEWFTPGDARSLATAIRRLIQDPARARAMGERVRMRSEEFTWDARGRRVRAVVERMWSARGAQ